VYKDELNMRLTFLERAQKQKMKILDSLIATREAKSKDTSRMIHDPSSYAAKLLDKAKELTEKAAEHGMVEAECTTVEDKDADQEQYNKESVTAGSQKESSNSSSGDNPDSSAS
jgi:hypothetical protein